MSEADRLIDDLQCPRCSSALDDLTRCAGCGAEFPTVDGQPVLIDFDDSIFARSDYASGRKAVVPATGGRIGRSLDRLTYGRSDATAGAIGSLLREVHALPRRRVLVIGGGTIGQGTEALYADGSIDLIATDITPTSNTVLVCDGHRLPFKDGSFDGVVVQAVLEHVLEPATVVREIHRVLGKDGVVFAETPFLQAVHMGAYDFTRFTFSGHRWLFRRFEEIDAGAILGTGVTLVWSVRQGLRNFGLGEKAVALLTAGVSPFRMALERRRTPRAALDGASAFFFLGRRSDKALQPRDMVDYYEMSGEQS